MKKLIFAVILVFSQLSWAIGLRCESIFETRESNSSALNILVQNIITGNQTLNYDAAKDIVSLSLDETRQSVWNELVQKNENRGKRPSIPRYALKSEADVYLAVVKFMRKEVELSLRGSKAQFIFQGVGFDRNQRQDPLVEAIFHEVHFLNDLRENFNSSPEVNAVNYSAQNFLQRNLKLFWRIFLSSFRDTRVQICNSTIRSQKMDLDSQISDPGQLRAYIGKNIRLETGLRTTFKYYNRIQMALLAGALAILSVDAYDSHELYKSWSGTQTTTTQKQNINALNGALPSDGSSTKLTPEENQFYSELKQELKDLQ